MPKICPYSRTLGVPIFKRMTEGVRYICEGDEFEKSVFGLTTPGESYHTLKAREGVTIMSGSPDIKFDGCVVYIDCSQPTPPSSIQVTGVSGKTNVNSTYKIGGTTGWYYFKFTKKEVVTPLTDFKIDIVSPRVGRIYALVPTWAGSTVLDAQVYRDRWVAAMTSQFAATLRPAGTTPNRFGMEPDFTIRLSDGQEVKCHKYILSSRFSFFEEVLATSADSMELDWDPKHLRLLLYWAYTGSDELIAQDIHGKWAATTAVNRLYTPVPPGAANMLGPIGPYYTLACLLNAGSLKAQLETALVSSLPRLRIDAEAVAWVAESPYVGGKLQCGMRAFLNPQKDEKK